MPEAKDERSWYYDYFESLPASATIIDIQRGQVQAVSRTGHYVPSFRLHDGASVWISYKEDGLSVPIDGLGRVPVDTRFKKAVKSHWAELWKVSSGNSFCRIIELSSSGRNPPLYIGVRDGTTETSSSASTWRTSAESAAVLNATRAPPRGVSALARWRRTSCHSQAPPIRALQALWWAARGSWDRAHTLVQHDGTEDAACFHAHLHRVEGDLKTQATGTEKPDAPLRRMRWRRNVPALQPSYFDVLKRRRSLLPDALNLTTVSTCFR